MLLPLRCLAKVKDALHMAGQPGNGIRVSGSILQGTAAEDVGSGETASRDGAEVADVDEGSRWDEWGRGEDWAEGRHGNGFADVGGCESC